MNPVHVITRCLRSIIILCFHLHTGLPSGLSSLQIFRPKSSIHSSGLAWVLHVQHISRTDYAVFSVFIRGPPPPTGPIYSQQHSILELL